jgi:dynein light intermediate chain 1
LQTLIHSSLGIQSLLKKHPLKHNVIDRDKVVLPPNWDSWGKIRVLRDGFDVEGVNQGWSLDIEEPKISENERGGLSHEGQKDVEGEGALAVFEQTIRDPTFDLRPIPNPEISSKGLDVQSLDAQAFLANQFDVLERIKHNTESSGSDGKRELSSRKISQSGVDSAEEYEVIEEGRVNEHIGPVQFNMGGIQVDADDMLQRLKVCYLCSLTIWDKY